jgi:hypothetical protein
MTTILLSCPALMIASPVTLHAGNVYHVAKHPIGTDGLEQQKCEKGANSMTKIRKVV